MMKNGNSITFGSLLLLLYFSIFRFCISDVKVVDLIQFNGDVLANLRYKYLEGVIDLFVIVEGTYTFSGFRKEKLYINIHEDWFKEIEDKGKVLKVVFDEKPTINKGDGLSILRHESSQKDYAVEKIFQYFGNESFILLSCDADEIPKREIVAQFKDNYDDLETTGAFLDMVYFYYNFRWVKNSKWQRAMVLNDRLLRKSRADRVTLHELRMIGEFTIIKNAGWHCSYCMSNEKILHKYLHSINSSSSSSVTSAPSTALSISDNSSNASQWISHCIDNGIDLFLRKESHEQLSLYDGKLGYPSLPGVIDISGLQYLQKMFSANGTFMGFKGNLL